MQQYERKCHVYLDLFKTGFVTCFGGLVAMAFGFWPEGRGIKSQAAFWYMWNARGLCTVWCQCMLKKPSWSISGALHYDISHNHIVAFELSTAWKIFSVGVKMKRSFLTLMKMSMFVLHKKGVIFLALKVVTKNLVPCWVVCAKA